MWAQRLLFRFEAMLRSFSLRSINLFCKEPLKQGMIVHTLFGDLSVLTWLCFVLFCFVFLHRLLENHLEVMGTRWSRLWYRLLVPRGDQCILTHVSWGTRETKQVDLFLPQNETTDLRPLCCQLLDQKPLVPLTHIHQIEACPLSPLHHLLLLL